MDLLHVVPLVLIALIAFAAATYKIATGKYLNSSLVSAGLLVLCSVGVISGNHIHHGEMIAIMDPCWGYAATLIGVALHMVRKSLGSSSVSARQL